MHFLCATFMQARATIMRSSCVHSCMHGSIYVCMHTYMRCDIHALRRNIYVYIHDAMYVCMHPCIYTFIMYLFTIHAYMRGGIHIYIYIYRQGFFIVMKVIVRDVLASKLHFHLRHRLGLSVR